MGKHHLDQHPWLHGVWDKVLKAREPIGVNPMGYIGPTRSASFRTDVNNVLTRFARPESSQREIRRQRRLKGTRATEPAHEVLTPPPHPPILPPCLIGMAASAGRPDAGLEKGHTDGGSLARSVHYAYRSLACPCTIVLSHETPTPLTHRPSPRGEGHHWHERSRTPRGRELTSTPRTTSAHHPPGRASILHVPVWR